MNRTTLSRIIRRVEFSMLNNFQSAPQTVLINSIPKAGTHLMSSMLNEIPQLSISLDLTDLDKLMNDDARLRLFKSKTKESTQGIWLGHIPYTKSIDQLLLELNIPVIFIYRDPRDIVVSLLHYAIKNENHIYHEILREQDASSALQTLIRGYGNGTHHYELSHTSIPSLSNYVNAYSAWIDSKNCIAISYEDLMGINQDENLDRLCNYLNLNRSVKKLLKRGIGNKASSTLREGKIKTWTSEITNDAQKEINAQAWTDSSLKTFFHG